jgi:hypothetical protein
VSAIDAICDELRAAAPHAPETLETRVRALAPAVRVRRQRPLRRALVFGVPAAAALVVAAAVGYGIADSGSPPASPGTHEAASTVVASGAREKASPTSTVPGRAVLQGSFGASGGGVVAPSPTRVQHYDASLTVRVRDRDRLGAATTSAVQLARSLGGWVASVEQVERGAHDAQAFVELRIPTRNVQDAIARLAGLGTIVAQQVSVRDLQTQLDRQRNQILSLRETIALVEEQLRNPNLRADERVRLEVQLANAKRQLARWRGAEKGTVAAGATARVSLVLSTQKAAAAAHHRSRFDRAVHGALSFLAAAGAVALYVLIVLAPVLVLAGLVLAWRRWDARRLLET